MINANKPIMFALALSCVLLPQTTAAQEKPEIFKVYTPQGETMRFNALSDNGKYAVSQISGDMSADNPQPAGAYLVDLHSQELTILPAPSGWAGCSDVADNGTVAGSYEGQPAFWSPTTGEWTLLPVPKDAGNASLLAITPDAKYAVGYYGSPTDIMQAYPLLYDLTSCQPIDTPNLPEVDLEGENKHQNLFYGISPDGRYLLGQMSQSYLMPVALFTYVYDTQNHDWAPLGYSYNSLDKSFVPRISNLHFVSNQHFSCDGLWVTGSAYMVFDGGQAIGGEEAFYPYRYNVATQNLEVFSSDASVSGDKIYGEGIVLGHSPSDNPYPTAMIRSGKYFISLDQVLAQVYGTSLYQQLQETSTGAFEAISADGRTAIMVTYDNCYVIRMPETFDSAAAKVDLLADYILDIPSGSALSAISEVKITFDRPIAVYNQASRIKIYDKDGNEVRAASGFSVSTHNDHQAVIAFRNTALNPGENYSLVIPEGMVWIADDSSIKNHEITATYIGREAKPVEAVSILPTPGSSLAQLDSYPDVVTLTFDTPVSIASQASCLLYNDDSGEIVTTMMMAASGNSVIVYPVSTYMLYKGSNYRVHIAEGSITDITGANPCNEIDIAYAGAYVRSLSADDMYIFNSSCDDYQYFMMWKGQWHQPASIPESWGFTSDNAWMLVRSSEESTDQALASHSMFNPAGQSDDWLVTPQLYIPDQRVHLAFDAQSYLNNSSDTLRVYVYAQDQVYNYIYDDQAQAIRQDGQLVFEQVLSPGQSQEGLEGDWSRYVVDLADYDGQNIYIAFVNHNYDESAIFLNDVQVIRDMPFLVSMITPSTVVAEQSIAIKGMLSTPNELADYHGLWLQLKDAQGNPISTIDDQTATLRYGDSYEFTFDQELPLTIGEETRYSIELLSGADVTNYDFSVKDLSFMPSAKVVLEEFAGADCSNCPLGIVAIDYLKTLYPDNFLPLAIRSYGGDPLGAGLGDYTAFLGMTGAPSARINRGEIVMPVYQGADGMTFSGKGYHDENGNDIVLWTDAVQQALNTPAEADIDLQATYDTASGDISVNCQVTFALNTTERSISVFAVVAEDGLSTRQLNGYAGYSDPLLGEWGAGGIYDKQVVRTWLADDVVRSTLCGNSYSGLLLPQSDFAANQSCSITIDSSLEPGLLQDPEKCHVVAMIIDGGRQRVINANTCAINTTGIADTAVVATDCDPVYYNLQGVRVEKPQPGQLYIKVQGANRSKIIYKP